MDSVDSELQAFAASARAYLLGGRTHARLRERRSAPPALDRAAWKAVCELGWPAILVPEHDGGLGLGLEFAAAILEEAGRALLPEPLLPAMQAIGVLARLPATALRDRLLATALVGDCVPGLAWQEGPGLDAAQRPGTVAMRDGERVTVQGHKRWVAPGAEADGWLVQAHEQDAGSLLLWVPAGARGVRCEAQERADGSSMAMLVLEGVTLQAADAIVASGDPTWHAVRAAADDARLLQAAELLGIARHAFEVTLAYLQTRVQFGKPIGANQALQHRMADALLQIELAQAGLRAALGDAKEADQLGALASRAKARCVDTTLHVARLAVQFHGAMGYTDECEVGLYLKRALHLASWLGNASEHRLRMLRGLPPPPMHPASAGTSGSGSWAPPTTAELHALDEGAFRATVRRFFSEYYPADLRHVSRRLHWHEIRHWYMTLSAHGWLAPSWPVEHGGMGLPPAMLVAFIEEQEAYGVARMPDQGLINLGPMLIAHGTPQQQRRWLPPILAGENVWCQGYSEPNAGSDLAALRTEAVLSGDQFVVNGQKIWTTLAQDATHMFMLVRTGKFARRQEGISFLLVDLATPGVTVRPILNIAGEDELCEVYFDNVRVPAENLVGQLHDGWTLAKSLLSHERIFIGSPKTCDYAMTQLRQLARASGQDADPVFEARLAQLLLDVADLRALYSHYAEVVKRGDDLPASVSLLKIWASETYGHISTALMELAGDDGGAWGRVRVGEETVSPLAPLMNSLVTSIYGGTNEIQRNIVARQVLGLP
jgi:alkylation response protein AidB-like acyl-CoA dehydrogenase